MLTYLIIWRHWGYGVIEDKLHKNKLTYFAAKHANSCQKCDETSKKIVKETHKSQVYDVKNKTFVKFALEKRILTL